MKGAIGGVINSVVLFSALMFTNLVQTLSFAVRPFSRKAFRAINRRCASAWWGMCVVGAERLHGVEFRISGDPIPPSENALIIANHQQMPDIVALMALGYHHGRLGDMKWFVKDIIKFVPGIGWGMWFLDCVFLKRDWESDAENIRATFSKFRDEAIPLWLVSFSEGTRITPEKLARSREYAAKQGIPLPSYTLIPRTKGFVATLTGLRTHIQAVYDVTIGYPSGIPTLWEFVQGKVRGIHLHVRRFSVVELPLAATQLPRWLVDRFQEKDKLLKYFHQHACFPV